MDKMKKPGKRKIIKLLIFFILLCLLIFGLWLYDTVRNDPNYLIKKSSSVLYELHEDQPKKVSFTYKSSGLLGKMSKPVFSFKPSESAEYTFSVTDISTEDDVYMQLDVMNGKLTNYLVSDNFESGDRTTVSGSAYLTEGTECMVIVQPVTKEEKDSFSASYTLTVSKAAEDIEPAEVTLDEKATVTVGKDEQVSVLFRPGETGYYRFASRIVSKDDSSGSSDIMSITSSDGKEIKTYEGICILEEDKDYYVWVSADEIKGKSTDVRVSCKKIESLTAEDKGAYSIAGETIIEYKADADTPLAIYSVSDGNTKASVYDSKGFPVSSDDDSGESLSGNEKDFAIVIQPQSGKKYYIYVGGKFTDSMVYITDYIGDGTSIGPEDILPVGPAETADDENPETEQSDAETGQEPGPDSTENTENQ